MDSRTASHIKGDDLVSIDDLIQGVDKGHDDADYQQLLRSNSTNNSSKGDQNRSDTIWRPGDGLLIDQNVVSLERVEDLSPESTEQDVELHHDGVDEEGIGEGRVGMGLDEGH